MENIKAFKVIGISVETTNQEGQAVQDIGQLWQHFFQENIPAQIKNKESEDIYSIYTDYETDFTGKYTCIIGFRVSHLDEIPKGLIGRNFEGGPYQKLIAKGMMPNAVGEKWQEIWRNDAKLNRKYTADFELYTEKSQQGVESEVDIYLAVKE